MKALLRKDLYVILSQFKILFLVMIVSIAFPSGLFGAFILIYYSVMLTTVSLMSVDEQSQWDSLALMLPYSRGQIVTAKYIMGWLGIAVALVLSLVSQSLYAMAGISDIGSQLPAVLCLYAAIALAMQAVMLPVNFRFGYAKGRFATILIAVFFGALVGASIDDDTATKILPVITHIHPIVYLLLAAAICAATIPLSTAGYKKRVEK